MKFDLEVVHSTNRLFVIDPIGIGVLLFGEEN